jgi:hypothetical protein
MKASKAPKQLIGWFPVLVVVVPCLWGLVFWLRDWPLAVIAACMSVYLVLDALNLVKMKKAARKESKGLKDNVPGT